MSSVVIHPAVEPGVIDNDMLTKCVLEQGPKGEAGRLFAEEGVHLDEVEVIRLEFLNIIRIDHLWMLKSLTKLALNHNLIEDIENLELLTNLKELDLSFNSISKIQNLNELINIEVLILSYNKISKIENLETLEKMIVLGLAGNEINNYKEIVCLRRFRELRSVSFQGNPCCKDPKAIMFIKAALPKVTYVDYALVLDEDRENCIDEFSSLINKLNEADEVFEAEREKKEGYEAKVKFYSLSFVEYLSGPELFIKMFDEDSDGSLLLETGFEITQLKNEYQEFYVENMEKLVNFGLSQYSVREKEVEAFNETMNEAREGCAERSKEIVDYFIKEKQEMLDMMSMIVESVSSESVTFAEVEDSVRELCEKFNFSIKDLWIHLMKEEMQLYEVCEETRIQFAQNVKDLANKMIESTRANFGRWREREGAWNLSVGELMLKLISNTKGMVYENDELHELMLDKDRLMDTIAQSMDNHMRFIDNREDIVITRVNEWQDNLLQQASWEEIKRDRNKVLEISYYIESQRTEWKELFMEMFINDPDTEHKALLQSEEDVKSLS